MVPIHGHNLHAPDGSKHLVAVPDDDRQRLIPSVHHVDAVEEDFPRRLVHGHFVVVPAALAHGDGGDDLVGRPINDRDIASLSGDVSLVAHVDAPRGRVDGYRPREVAVARRHSQLQPGDDFGPDSPGSGSR